MKIRTTIAALAIAGMTAPAMAQMGQQQQGQQDDFYITTSQQWKGPHQQQQQQAQQQVRGQIQDVRSIRLSGEREPHVLAKIKTEQGQTAVLDLGPVSQLRQQQVQLRRGQQLQARGQAGRIQDMPIIVVDQLGTDGAVVFLPALQQQQQQRQQQMRMQQQRRQPFAQQQRFQQQQQPQQQRFGQQPMGRQQEMARQRQFDQQRMQQRQAFQPQQQRQLAAFEAQRQAPQRQGQVIAQGQLIEARGVNLQGLPDAHQLAKLRTREGQTVIVDLGTGRELQDVNLSQGEWVAVTGRAGRINGRPVIFADAVADIAQIDRSQEERASQFLQQRQQQQQRQRGETQQ